MVVALTMLVACGDAQSATTAQGDIAAVAQEIESQSVEAEQEAESAKATDAIQTENAETNDAAKAGDKVDENETVVATGKVNSSEEVTATEDEKADEAVVDMTDIKALDVPVTMYAQQTVNIRKGPDTKYDKLGSLSMNDEVSVIGESKSKPWKEIQYKDGIAFVHADFLSTEKIDIEALKAQQEAAAAAQAEAANQQAQTTVASQPVVNAPAGVIFIGDSRTCQMRAATGGANCTWICEYSTRYEWFAETAVPQADPIVGKGTKVVICMGVNDPGSCNSYANLVNQKAAEWNARGAKVYYVSLNPVDHPYEDKVAQIDNFNGTMPSLLSGVKWIDTASVVKQGGFVLEDGIHYDAAGNASIFNMIIRSL